MSSTVCFWKVLILTLNRSIRIDPPKTTPKRVELKQEINGDALPFFLRKIAINSLFFQKKYPNRVINSIYFDTHSLSTFDDSVSGNQIRKKHRIRWYDEHSGKSKVTYEIKCKDSQLSWKYLYKTSHRINAETSRWGNLFDNEKGLKDLNFPTLLNLHPITLVSYERSYFESWNKKIRMTLDSKISFRSQRLLTKPNFKIFSYHTRSSIVELKFSEEDLDLVKEVQKILKFKPQRFSKYCESVTANNYSAR